MSLPPPPKQWMRVLNGYTVCYDHYRRSCHICCMDFTDEPRRSKPDAPAGNDGVFVLRGRTSRFIPQLDDEILGRAKTMEDMEERSNLQKPLGVSSIKLHECSTCQLTWLIGESGFDAGKSHPSHHTHASEGSGTSRSLFVFADGACTSNGLPNARAGVGIFFAKRSKFNMSKLLALPGPATNQKAELAAVALALETVRLKVLPERLELVTKAPGGNDPRTVKYAKQFRLVIVTDSSYVVEGMCSYIDDWRETGKGEYINKDMKIVANLAGFLKIKTEVEKLSKMDVQVAYYHVLREENKEADALAGESLKRLGVRDA